MDSIFVITNVFNQLLLSFLPILLLVLLVGLSIRLIRKAF